MSINEALKYLNTYKKIMNLWQVPEHLQRDLLNFSEESYNPTTPGFRLSGNVLKKIDLVVQIANALSKLYKNTHSTKIDSDGNLVFYTDLESEYGYMYNGKYVDSLFLDIVKYRRHKVRRLIKVRDRILYQIENKNIVRNYIRIP